MAGTTADKLEAALRSKERVREAIEEKGIPCGADVPFSQYGNKIRSLGGGGLMCGRIEVGSYRIPGVHIPISYIGTFVKQTT